MRCIALTTAFAFVLSTTAAQTPRLPTFTYPARGAHQSRWLSANWPAWLRTQIRQNFACHGCGDVTVVHVDLGVLGAGALVSRFKDEGGQGENDFTFAVVYKWHGRSGTYVFAGPGASGGQVVMSAGPVPDLIGTQDYPCCSANATRFSFRDGMWSESGCDSLSFGGALWDLKDMEIRNCYDRQ